MIGESPSKSAAPRVRLASLPWVLLAVAALYGLALPLAAQPPQPRPYCYAVADSGDTLVYINKDGGAFGVIGATNTGAIEAIAFDPSTGTLYAANAATLGTLDLTNGDFTAVAGTFGTCSSDGTNSFTVNDVDSMQFDFNTGILWGAERNSGPTGAEELLLQIDPATGLVVADSFGPGISCLIIDLTDPLLGPDIDDLAVDPTDGTIYAIANSGGADDSLAIIDPSNGSVTRFSPLDNTDGSGVIEDMEGLSFGLDGTLYSTTGGASGGNSNRFWIVDKETGDTTLVAAFGSGSDYEAVACQVDNLITGTVFYDFDQDGLFDPLVGDAGFGGATVTLYIDEDGSGDFSAGDTPIATRTTASDGSYLFVAGQGDFVVTVDPATLPAGSTLTTANDPDGEAAAFADSDYGVTDPDNDFGFIVPPGSGDLDITKTSDAGGPVVQGQTFEYTIVVTNNSGFPHTGVELTDLLPPGVSYEPQTTVATGPTEFYVRDEFGSVSYGNNDGRREWSGNWVEDPADDGDPSLGRVQVLGGALRLFDETSATFEPSAARSVDLTGSAIAFLSFDFRTTTGVDVDDSVIVEVASSSGGPFTALETFTGITGSLKGTRVFDISGFISADTTVRFRVDALYGGADEFFFVDNVEIRRAQTWVDRFEAPFDFDNQDGTRLWSSDWQEVGEADGATAGDIQVLADPDLGFGVLRIADNDNGGEGVSREADLSGATSAFLSFDFRRTDLDDAGDWAKVEVSRDGGASWKELDRFLGPADDAGYSRRAYDISAFIASNTLIRFLSSPDLGGGDEVYFDNVTIDVRGTAIQTLDNFPGAPNLDLVDGAPTQIVEPGDGFVLGLGQTLTVTFDVTVDNPLDPYRASLLNTAIVDSVESSVPEVAYHLDPVVSGAMGDRVWLDSDGDGIQDIGEPGIPNVEVTLFDAGGNGVPGGGDDVAVGTLLTGADGEYLFDHLPPGTYFVEVTDATVPPGLVLSPGSTDPSATHTVVTDEETLAADFGYRTPPGTGAIGDYLWNDIDRDGIQDPGEVGLGGVTLELIDRATGLPVGAPVTTAADGSYLFAGLPLGEYEVRVTDTGGVLTGFSPTAGPQSEGANVSTPVTVTPGDTITDVDFGYAPDGCLPRIDFETDALGNPLVAGQEIDDEWAPWGVTVSFTINDPSTGPAMLFDSFNPTGGDVDLGSPNETCIPPGPGVGTEGELGMPGENCFPQGGILILSEDGDSSDPDDAADGGTITFTFAADQRIEALEFLDAENNLDSVELFDEFDNSIFFSNLAAPGDNAFELLPVNTGGARRMVITFPASGSVAAIDFCLGSIRDKVWLDLDGDGLFDVGEVGIPGVTVDLLSDPDGIPGNGDEVVIGTAVTDANGDFGFDGLEDGDYLIVITDTAGKLSDLGGTTAPAQAGDLAVTIIDGDDVRAINFGYNAAGTLGDRVWSDADGDGVEDPSELGIAGVLLNLLDGGGSPVLDGMGNPITATTGPDGGYLFSGLLPGDYIVEVDPSNFAPGAALDGYALTGDPDEPGPCAVCDDRGGSALTLGESDLTRDFGYQNAALADISGNVFEDLDVDGVDDGAGEPGFLGVTLALLDAAGNVVATTTTDANGDYLFADVPDGSYTVAVTDDARILEGYTLTSGLDAIEVIVDAVAIGDVTGIDFGYVRSPGAASIGDAVWYDINGDGIQNLSEPGISQVLMTLFDAGPDGQIGGGDDVQVDQTLTDANGQYLFDGLPAGNYYVQITPPAGLVRTDSNGVGNDSSLIALSEGEDYNDADFGYGTAAGTVSIGDTVWADANGDGVQQPGEIGIAGITVNLLDDMGMPVASAITGPDGTYLFSGLVPAEYTVEVDPTGLAPQYGTTPTNGPLSRDFDLSGGVDVFHADFGFPPQDATGSIGDLIWLDADGDGVLDAGEPGIEGVTVNLLDPLGNVLATTTTGPDGSYDFVGLPAGDYQVEVTDIGGVLAELNLSSGSNPTATISLAQGEDFNDADFPYAPSGGIGSIGSTIWHDVDQSMAVGILDPGEPGFQGVTVELWLDVNGDGAITAGIDNLVRTTVTDVNGEYEFLGLPPAMYVVDVTDERNVLAGFDPVLGPNPGMDNNGQTDPYPVTLTAAEPNNLTADFAYAAINPFVLSGVTYFDSQGNAVIDGDDQGVGGVTLRLFRDLNGDGVLDPDEPQIGTTTSAPAPVMGGDPPEGFYEFVDLPNGFYIVVADPVGTFLAGTTQTTQGGSGGVQPAQINDADSLDNDFGYFIAPTAVLVSRFGATVDRGRLVVEWETASQTGTAGFYLYRFDEDSQEWLQVNERLLPAVMGAPQGAVYRFADEAASAAGVYDYSLVEIESSGGERIYGPYRVKADWGTEREPMSSAYAAAERRPSARSLERLAVARRVRAERAAATRPDDAGLAADGGEPLTRGGGRQSRMRAKIAVEERGLTFVSAADLAAALGWFEVRVAAMIERGLLTLRNRAESVAYQPAAGGAGLWFFAEAADSLYTRENVYRVGTGPGEWMASADGGSPAPVEGGAFRDRRTYEEDRFAATLVTRDPASDYWFWEFLSAGSEEHGRKGFELHVPAPAGAAGEARLEVRLFGATDTPAVADHHATVTVNGVEVGETIWDGVTAHSFVASFPQGLLAEGVNVVEVEALLDGEVPYSVVYVDGFELRYDRLYRAAGDRLEFRGDKGGVVTVSGFSSPDIRVYEIDDERRPKAVANLTVDKGDGYRVSLATASPQTAYLAVAGPAVFAPVSVRRDRPSNLRGESAEYVVIAASELVAAAAELADYRRSASGLSTVVVDVEDVYDEFNHGLASPEALRRFLSVAWNGWAEAPRFVALVGAGTYDYRDLRGFGGNLLPPLMRGTPYGLFSSDQRLVDVEGDDGVPEIAVGRIPVLTAGELAAYVDKLAAYEAAGGTLGAVLLAADDADGAGNFASNSEALAAALPEGVTAERVYLDELTVGEARDRLFELLDAGIDWVNYVGHGGLDRLAEEGLVTSGDAAAFAAAGRTPVVTSLTCSAGRFAIPGFESLAEALVIEEGAGAVAVWSPSGQSLDPEAAVLDRAFLEAVYGDGAGTLGEAIRRALERYAEDGNFRFMLDHYNLLGDPALELD